MKQIKNLCLLFILLGCYSGLKAQINGGKKILIVCTSSTKDVATQTPYYGCYYPEVADFYTKLYQHGFRIENIDIVSPQGGAVPLIYDDAANCELVMPAGEEPKLRSRLAASLQPQQVVAEDYNVIFYAGGYSCLTDYPVTKSIGDITAKIYETNGIVAAVCDGISGLVPIELSTGGYLINGIKVTCNEYNKQTEKIDVAELLADRGGIVDKNTPVFSDKRVVTGKNVRPVEVATEVLKLLGFSATTLPEIVTQPVVSCYPNPTTGNIRINLTTEKNTCTAFELMDMSGKSILVKKAELLPGHHELEYNLAGLPAGTYFVKFTQNTAPPTNFKVLIVR